MAKRYGPYLAGIQRKWLKQLLRQLQRRNVALLQAPTGSGKTRVAIAVAAALGRSRRGGKLTRVTVVLPRYPASEDRNAFAELRTGNTHNNWIRDAAECPSLKVLIPKGLKFQFLSRKDLLARRNGLPRRGEMLIVDEVHRFRSQMMRWCRPGRQSPTGWLLLLSATPVNPVRLRNKDDRLAIDGAESLELEAIQRSYRVLYMALAQCGLRLSRNPSSRLEFEEAVELLRRSKHQLDHVQLRRWLNPVPSATDLMSERPQGKFQPGLEPEGVGRQAQGIRLLDRFYRANVQAKAFDREAVEAMLLSGAFARPVKSRRAPKYIGNLGHQKGGPRHQISEATYAMATFEALRNGQPGQDLIPSKVEALADWIRSPGTQAYLGEGKRILVFCSYRGGVAGLSEALEHLLAGKEVSKLDPKRHMKSVRNHCCPVIELSGTRKAFC